jgi:hypothetical protein
LAQSALSSLLLVEQKLVFARFGVALDSQPPTVFVASLPNLLFSWPHGAYSSSSLSNLHMFFPSDYSFRLLTFSSLPIQAEGT